MGWNPLKKVGGFFTGEKFRDPFGVDPLARMDPLQNWAHGQFTDSSPPPGAPQPGYPTRGSLIDPETGLLREEYRIGDFDPLRGLGEYERMAFQEGQSPWEKMMMERQKEMELMAVDQAMQGAMRQQAQAQSQMAMRGGLSQGARERMARETMRGGRAGQQQARRAGIEERLGIGLGAEERRLSALQAFSQGEQGQRDFEARRRQFDIASALSERHAQQQAAMEKYKADMAAWAAERQAQATMASQQGGGGKK